MGNEMKLMDVYKVLVERCYDGIENVWKISRIVFQTNCGDIIHKPFKEMEVSQEVGGKKMCLVHKEKIRLEELHPMVLEVSHKSIDEGICKILTNFQSLVRGGEIYRSFSSEDIHNLELLPIEEKVKGV